jgi:hypothetical protein
MKGRQVEIEITSYHGRDRRKTLETGSQGRLPFGLAPCRWAFARAGSVLDRTDPLLWLTYGTYGLKHICRER